jgi:hypothetical protein
MSKAASAFSSRRSFVNRKRLSLDSTGFFAATDVAAQRLLRALIPIQRIAEQTIVVWRYIFDSLWKREIAQHVASAGWAKARSAVPTS